MIRILAVGKKHEPWVIDGIERYQRRLKRPFDISWELIPHSLSEDEAARQEESSRLLARINQDDFVMLLDERGKLLDSPSLSKTLLIPLESSQKITLVIGGAYGVNEELMRRANLVWSLSPLVFPHQLVRLILIEQLYRAQEIAARRPYHHK